MKENRITEKMLSEAAMGQGYLPKPEDLQDQINALIYSNNNTVKGMHEHEKQIEKLFKLDDETWNNVLFLKGRSEDMEKRVAAIERGIGKKRGRKLIGGLLLAAAGATVLGMWQDWRESQKEKEQERVKEIRVAEDDISDMNARINVLKAEMAQLQEKMNETAG